MRFERKEYVNRLDSMKWNGLIKVITGMRRAGKSFLLNNLFYEHLLQNGVERSHIIRFAFDSDDDLDLLDSVSNGEKVKIKDSKQGYIIDSKAFRRYVSSLINEDDHFYLFLDEVQFLENFAGTLNGYLKRQNIDIYVTGSNSRFLSADIATEFRGRSSELHVLPLAFSEYVDSLDENPQKAWARYIITGGLPLVALMKDERQQMDYLKSLTLETYLKDIIQRNRIRKTQELAETFDIFASIIGSPLNPTKVANTFRSLGYGDISSQTICSYLECFGDAFVLNRVSKYSIKGRKYVNPPFKVYFEDLGIRNARLNFRQIEEPHIMENIIYNELRYRGFNVDVGEVVISEDTGRIDKNNHAVYAPKSFEVDFVATLGNKKYYIQSALDMTSSQKQIQEKKSLYYIDDSFKKIIVTKNGLGVLRDEKGVVTIDLFDFLLNENSLDL